MIIFYPPNAAPRVQKIGRTVFTIRAAFCGRESIYGKLAELMEAELYEIKTPESIANTENNCVDFRDEIEYTVADTMPLLSDERSEND